MDVGCYLRRDELPPDDTAEIVNAFVIPTELVTLAIAVTVKTSSYELLSLELFPTARGDSYRNEFIVMGCSENMLKRKNDHAE